MTGLTGKKVKIFFDDTGKVLIKEGTIISEDIVFVQIKTFRGLEAIPTNHIIRVEVLG